MMLAAGKGAKVTLETDGPGRGRGDGRARRADRRLLRRGRLTAAPAVRAMVSFALHGIGVSGGIAIGRAQLVSHATLEVAHYAIPPAQRRRRDRALRPRASREVRRELEGLHAAMTGGDAPAEFGAFLDVHWMILNDPTLSEVPKKIIAEQRCNAEWALTQQMDVLVEQFERDRGPVPARAQGRRRAGGRAGAEAPAGQARARSRRRAPRSRRSSSRTTSRRPTSSSSSSTASARS